MEIQVNGKTHTLSAATSITTLLSVLQVQQQTGIAIAINDVVVPRPEWPTTLVNNQDDILIITATQGG
ncbi:MAG: sulfur carrier protein ThiS [Bacteroidota bacterium]